jgi:flagellar hook-length control protein FliK
MDMKLIPSAVLENQVLPIGTKRQANADNFGAILSGKGAADDALEAALSAVYAPDEDARAIALTSEDVATPDDTGQVQQTDKHPEIETSLQEGYAFFGGLFHDMAQRIPDEMALRQRDAIGTECGQAWPDEVHKDQTGSAASSHLQTVTRSAILFDFAREKKKHREALEVAVDPTVFHAHTENRDLAVAKERAKLSQKLAHDAGQAANPDQTVDAASSARAPVLENVQPLLNQPQPPSAEPSSAKVVLWTSANLTTIAEGVAKLLPNAANPLASTPFKHGQTLRINLHPLELGSVDVSIASRGQVLRVTLIPALDDTRRLLQDDAEKLLLALGLTNTDMRHVEVQIEQPAQLTDENSSSFARFSSQPESQSAVLQERERPRNHDSRTARGLANIGVDHADQGTDMGLHHRSPDAVYL